MVTKRVGRKNNVADVEPEILHNGDAADPATQLDFSSLAPQVRGRLRQLRAEQTELTQRLRDCDQEYQRLSALVVVIEPLASFQRGLITADEALVNAALAAGVILNAKKA